MQNKAWADREAVLGQVSAGVSLEEAVAQFNTDLAGVSGKLSAAGGAMTSNPAVETAGVRNISAGTTDLTAGSSALTTGAVYYVYE